jgi:hypothetical protein
VVAITLVRQERHKGNTMRTTRWIIKVAAILAVAASPAWAAAVGVDFTAAAQGGGGKGTNLTPSGADFKVTARRANETVSYFRARSRAAHPEASCLDWARENHVPDGGSVLAMMGFAALAMVAIHGRCSGGA